GLRYSPWGPLIWRSPIILYSLWWLPHCLGSGISCSLSVVRAWSPDGPAQCKLMLISVGLLQLFSRADAGSVIVWPGTWQHIADTNRTRWKRSGRQRELGVMGWCDSFHHCRSRTVHTGHHSIGEHPNTRHCGGR